MEIWQIAQARAALEAFREQYDIALDEKRGVEAGDYLIGLVGKGLSDPEALYAAVERILDHEPAAPSEAGVGGKTSDN